MLGYKCAILRNEPNSPPAPKAHAGPFAISIEDDHATCLKHPTDFGAHLVIRRRFRSRNGHCATPSPRCNAIPELYRRVDPSKRFDAGTRTSYPNGAIPEDAAQDRLINIDALHLG